MKAAVFSKYGSPEVLQLKEIEMPKPKADEVLIKVYAASVNDWDWGLVWGKPFVIRMLYGLFKPKKVKIPGVDVAGKVVGIGKSITRFKEGDEIFGDISESGFGSFAEYVCVKENAIAIKPASMPYEDAAALPHASLLAVQGLIDKGKLNQDQKILINGAGGGVGTIGIQLAQLHHVDNVTGVDSSEKLDMLLSMGFKHAIDFKRQDFTSMGVRYDLILDVKTNRSILKYFKALNKNGIYITVGGSMRKIISGAFLAPFISLLLKKKFILLTLNPNAGIDYIKKVYEAGKLKPIIDEKTYRLNEIPEALQYFGAGEHKGKVIIKIAGENY